MEVINNEILESNEANVEFVSVNEEPQYEIKLVDRSSKTSEEKVLAKIKENTTTTYKFYEVALNESVKTYVDTLEEATDVVNKIKEYSKKSSEDLDLKIVERYTQNKDEVKTDAVEIAENNLNNEINKQIEQKEEENSIATVEGVKIALKPVSTGIITSRYGESSRRRVSTHTGLDIACRIGTDIKVIANGTVIFAGNKGSYGNLVKVSHGNGVETWYAHCSKIYTTVGKEVKAGDVISAVGSTGNSTGSHLHLEIRINGSPVNPQKYLYK